MSPGFRRRGQAVEVTLRGEEASVLHGLVREIVELVRHDLPARESEPEDPVAALIGDYGGPSEPPEDVVLQRLFPSAYGEDDEAAAEFRRYTERGLRDQKVANAEIVLDSLGDPGFSDKIEVTVSAEQAQAWLRTLTDLRLAIGTRLEVAENDEERWNALPEDDPSRHVHHLYLWLGWLQESLIEAL